MMYLRIPEERAILFQWLANYYFSGSTIARSTRHRLFVATYLSVGMALGLLPTLAIRNGKIDVSPWGLRSFPFLIVFFAVSGLRAAFQFPAEPTSNWLFRTAEHFWSETSRRATRKRVLATALFPTLLLFVPVEIGIWGWRLGLFHFLFQAATGGLLVETLFWNFDKVPFTCSYFPGKASLAVLAGLYLYGFTTYSFRMAELEARIEGSVPHAVLFLAVTSAVLGVLWRRSPAPSSVQFIDVGQQIQTLDLT